jgi:hypothetical protein
MSVRSRRNPALGATLRPPLDLPARFVGLTVPTARPGLENPVGPEALQMVDLALPLGYHGRFRRLASVKLTVPTGLMKRGLPSSIYATVLRPRRRHAMWSCRTRRRFQGRASTRLTLSRRFGRTKREED